MKTNAGGLNLVKHEERERALLLQITEAKNYLCDRYFCKVRFLIAYFHETVHRCKSFILANIPYSGGTFEFFVDLPQSVKVLPHENLATSYLIWTPANVFPREYLFGRIPQKVYSVKISRCMVNSLKLMVSSGESVGNVYISIFQ